MKKVLPKYREGLFRALLYPPDKTRIRITNAGKSLLVYLAGKDETE